MSIVAWGTFCGIFNNKKIGLNHENNWRILRIGALYSRIAIILLGIIANTLIPDHDAHVFLSPTIELQSSFLDKIINSLLGGFVRWDGQHFMHIARYGYTYENNLAFFPLYPFLISYIAQIMTFVTFLNIDSSILLTFLTVNIFIFVETCRVLHNLTAKIFNEKLAFFATAIFCLNPASIFFTAPYTECLFCYLTFKTIWHSLHLENRKDCLKHWILSVFFIILSCCTRSNGLLNMGFLLYFSVRKCFINNLSYKTILLSLIKYTIFLVISFSLCLIPFFYIQYYYYNLFCKDFNNNYLPSELINYGRSNNFVMPGEFSKNNQTWCYQKIPLPYSYVQDKYWNVGFLNYYEFKQLPNFLLAFPLIYIVFINSFNYLLHHKYYFLHFGILKLVTQNKRNNNFYFKGIPCNNDAFFACVIHAIALLLFCVCFVHIQVTTRMICSASPVFYWFCAYYYLNKEKQINTKIRAIDCYLIGYCFIGTILFCNFLPWT